MASQVGALGISLHSAMTRPSKRNASEWRGRSDTNKTVIFPHDETADYIVGDTIRTRITRSTSATLFGERVTA